MTTDKEKRKTLVARPFLCSPYFVAGRLGSETTEKRKWQLGNICWLSGVSICSCCCVSIRSSGAWQNGLAPHFHNSLQPQRERTSKGHRFSSATKPRDFHSNPSRKRRLFWAVACFFCFGRRDYLCHELETDFPYAILLIFSISGIRRSSRN